MINMAIIDAQVEKISPLTASIVQLILKPERYIEYEAGQYLKILLGQDELCYSIANAPLGSHHYELHIRHSRDNPCNQELFAEIKATGQVKLSLPFGTCSLSHLDATRPILFIAGGTGFAPVHAMIEQLLINDDPRSFELFWGTRSANDLYLDEKLNHWESHTDQFKYFSLISEERSRLSALVLKEHALDLNDWQIVIGGPFDMVYNIRDILVHEGASPDYLFSDAFHFQPK